MVAERKPIRHTDEEILASIPHPELPIVYSPFSVGKDGSIACDGEPGLPERAQMNGYIEDILKAIAPHVAAFHGFAPKFGDGVVEVRLHVMTASHLVRAARTYWEIPELRYIGPDYEEPASVEDGEVEPIEKPKVQKVAVPLTSSEVVEFVHLLKPTTKFEVIQGDGILDRVIVTL